MHVSSAVSIDHYFFLMFHDESNNTSFEREQSLDYFDITVKFLLLNTSPKWSTCYTECPPVPPTRANFADFGPLLNDHLVILNMNAFFRSFLYKSTSIIWTGVYGATYLLDNISHLIDSFSNNEREKWLLRGRNQSYLWSLFVNINYLLYNTIIYYLIYYLQSRSKVSHRFFVFNCLFQLHNIYFIRSYCRIVEIKYYIYIYFQNEKSLNMKYTEKNKLQYFEKKTK